MTHGLSPRTRDEIDTAYPPHPVSWQTHLRESDAAYVVEARIEAGRRMAQRAIDTIASTHETVTARAANNPALEFQLRRIEETVSFCAAELIARYMGRH